MAASHQTIRQPLIVGGGPVGLFTALLLARHGFQPVVVERYPSPLRAPKAHVLNPRTLEIFRSAGLDIDHMRTLGPKLKDSGEVRFMSSLAGREYGWLPYERQDLGVLAYTPTPLMNLPQPFLEDYLGELIAATPAVDLRRQHVWKSVEQIEGRCRSTITGPTGTDYVFESDHVLACDGAGSSVRQALGIQMEGAAEVQSCLTIHFEANLREIVRDHPAIIYWVVNRAIAGAFVAHDIDRNWILIRFDQPNDPVDRVVSLEEARRMVLSAVGADADVTVKRAVPWLMTAEVATRFQAGGVFLIGDAAHRFPPNGGLGLNTGIQDAHNLAWKLAAVAEGWAAESVLDTYQTERRGVAKANSDQSLSNALTMPRLIGALVAAADYVDEPLPPLLAQEMKEAIAANAVTFDNLGLQLGFSYDLYKPLPPAPDVFEPRAEPGDRLPHAWINEAARQSVLDVLDDGAFTLLLGCGVHRPPASDLVGLPPHEIVEVGADWPADWLKLTGLNGSGMVLVRPDGHIAARVSGVGENQIEALALAASTLLGSAAAGSSSPNLNHVVAR